MPLIKPKGTANDCSLWLRVPYQVTAQVRSLATKNQMGVSEYLRRIVIAHINETNKAKPKERFKPPPKYFIPEEHVKGPYELGTPCIMEGRALTLKRAADILGVSFFYIQKHLRSGANFEKLVERCLKEEE